MIMSALMSTCKGARKGSASGHLCTGDVRIGELMPKVATPLSWDVVLGLLLATYLRCKRAGVISKIVT
jgi:hypothetical protein